MSKIVVKQGTNEQFIPDGTEVFPYEVAIKKMGNNFKTIWANMYPTMKKAIADAGMEGTEIYFCSVSPDGHFVWLAILSDKCEVIEEAADETVC